MSLRLTICATAAAGDLAAEEAPPARAQELQVPLDQPGLVFGRAPDADIRLPYPKVSARHARLFRDAQGYRLEDLGSTNGTRLAGRRLAPRVAEPIAFGEHFEIGGIDVHLDGESPGSDPIAAAVGTQTLARRLVHDLFEVGPPAEPARIVVSSGPDEGRALPLHASGRGFRVGRGEGCDLVLCDHDVSREHLAIERGPAGFTVRDLGSKNGIVVSQEVVTGERLLHDGDTIRLGETSLRFMDPEDRYLRQITTAPVSEAAVPAVVAATVGTDASRPPSKLPIVATTVAIIALLTALALVLALAFLAHL